MSTLDTYLSSLQFLCKQLCFSFMLEFDYILDMPLVHCTVRVHRHVFIPGEDQR